MHTSECPNYSVLSEMYLNTRAVTNVADRQTAEFQNPF